VSSIGVELSNIQINTINKEAEEWFRSKSIFYCYIPDKDKISISLSALFDILSLRIKSLQRNNKYTDLNTILNLNQFKLHNLSPYMIRQIYFPGVSYSSINSGSKMRSDLSADSFDNFYDNDLTSLSRDDSNNSFGNNNSAIDLNKDMNLNSNTNSNASNINKLNLNRLTNDVVILGNQNTLK